MTLTSSGDFFLWFNPSFRVICFYLVELFSLLTMVHTRSKMAATSSSATVSPSLLDKKGSTLKTFSPIPDSLKETTLDSDIMDNDYPSILTAKDLALLCTQNGLDPNLPIRLPEGDEHLDWYSENWATLCIDYFPLRKVVPLPKLILELCLRYDLAPS